MSGVSAGAGAAHLGVLCVDGEGVRVALVTSVEDVPEGEALGVALVQHHVGAAQPRHAPRPALSRGHVHHPRYTQ